MAVCSGANSCPDFNYTVRRVYLLFCIAIALLGCKKIDESAQLYETRGVVRGFSPDRQIVEIEHETIPDFMPSMTMPFSSRNPKEIVNLGVGDAIAFRMIVTKRDFWIDRIRKVDRNEVQVAEPNAAPPQTTNQSARLRDGDEMPVFSLTNQNGERVRLDTFRGRPFVLTFVFTRCPIPNFCPRMSSNFAELQGAIKTGTGPVAQTRLLSISLDPTFDGPSVLKEYGKHLQFDSFIWTFATGSETETNALTEAFSVYRKTEGGTISHGLATVLIDKNGRIDKIWRGNGWTISEVVEAIEKLP